MILTIVVNKTKKMEINFQDIDDAIIYFENKQFSDSSEKEFAAKFPVILSYLTSNQFSILSEEEYMILMFEAMVILKVLENKLKTLNKITSDKVEALESQNWDEFEALENMTIEEKATKLFNNSDDAIVDFIVSGFESDEEDDETMEITPAAKEILLISLKTIYDCYQN